VASVVPQDQDTCTSATRSEEQMIREAPQIRSPQLGACNRMKSFWVPRNRHNNSLKLLLKISCHMRGTFPSVVR